MLQARYRPSASPQLGTHTHTHTHTHAHDASCCATQHTHITRRSRPACAPLVQPQRNDMPDGIGPFNQRDLKWHHTIGTTRSGTRRAVDMIVANKHATYAFYNTQRSHVESRPANRYGRCVTFIRSYCHIQRVTYEVQPSRWPCSDNATHHRASHVHVRYDPTIARR